MLSINELIFYFINFASMPFPITHDGEEWSKVFTNCMDHLHTVKMIDIAWDSLLVPMTTK